MKTKIELEEDIMKIIAKIHDEFPELSKYITEMPLTGNENKKVMIKNLQDYNQTLEELVDKYAKTHLEKTSQKDD